MAYNLSGINPRHAQSYNSYRVYRRFRLSNQDDYFHLRLLLQSSIIIGTILKIGYYLKPTTIITMFNQVNLVKISYTL